MVFEVITQAPADLPPEKWSVVAAALVGTGFEEVAEKLRAAHNTPMKASDLLPANHTCNGHDKVNYRMKYHKTGYRLRSINRDSVRMDQHDRTMAFVPYTEN